MDDLVTIEMLQAQLAERDQVIAGLEHTVEFSNSEAFTACVFRRIWTAIPDGSGHRFRFELDS